MACLSYIGSDSEVNAMRDGVEKEAAQNRLLADEKHAHDLTHEASRLEEITIQEQEVHWQTVPHDTFESTTHE